MKSVFVLLLIVLCNNINASDKWKTAAGDFLGKLKDYYGYIRLIESKSSDKKPCKEKMLLLSWLYNRVNDGVNEKRCITQYFNSPGRENGMEFLDNVSRVRVYEFLNRWEKSYPSCIEIKFKSMRLLYKQEKLTFSFSINISAAAELQVYIGDRVVCNSFFLKAGRNLFDFISDHFRWDNNRVNFLFRTDKIELKRSLVIRRRVIKPDNVIVDWSSGNVQLEGREFRKEFETKTEIVKENYFDKKRFFNKALPHLLVGAGLIGINRMLISKRLDRNNISGGHRAFMEGAGGSTMVLGAGFSVKGVIEIIKSFRKRHKKIEREVAVESAVNHNLLLRKTIEDAADRVFVEYSCGGTL